MKIMWIGHACFLLEGRDGRVLTDPFDEKIPYTFLAEPVDVVTVSHEHFDHNAVDRVPGVHEIVRDSSTQTAHGISFVGVPAFHDAEEGSKRGRNMIYKFTLDGISIAHLGDLGHALSQDQIAALTDVEVILVPVGGFFTIDADQAADLVAQLPNVRVIIPMHYKTDRLSEDFPIDTVEKFAARMQNVRRIGNAEVTLTHSDLPAKPEVWILDYA